MKTPPVSRMPAPAFRPLALGASAVVSLPPALHWPQPGRASPLLSVLLLALPPPVFRV